MTFVSVQFCLVLLDYTSWGRERILAAAAGVESEKLLAPCGLDHGSIHETLVHQLAGEVLWRQRWTGAAPAKGLTTVDVPDFESLQRVWRAEDAPLKRFVAGLADDDLLRPISYVTGSGVARSEPLWQQLIQLVNHGTQHRSEIALELTHLGHSPGNLDFLIFAGEHFNG